MANKPKLELVPDSPHGPAAPPPAEHPTPGVGGYYERDPATGVVTRVPEPAAPQPSPFEPE